jgi:hypothetical protein
MNKIGEGPTMKCIQLPDGHMHELLDADGKPNGIFLGVVGEESEKICAQSHVEGETSPNVIPFYFAPPQSSWESEMRKMLQLLGFDGQCPESIGITLTRWKEGYK